MVTLVQGGAVLPIAGGPIVDGAVRVGDGRIEAVGSPRALTPRPGDRVLSLPDCILLPGLVNAHCHLELGGLAGRVPYPGSFPGWILNLVRQLPPDPAAVAVAVAAGARSLLAGGATCVGDITTTGWTVGPLRRAGIRAVAFRELLGLSPERAAAALATARAWLEEFGSPSSPWEGRAPSRRVVPGLSPHAPYSTASQTYRNAVELSEAAGVPLATHLSESPDEAEFLATGTGGFVELLQARGIPLDLWEAPGVSPVRYVAALGALSRPGTAAHVNYLQPGDLDLLAEAAMVPVYCPRSHRFFHHPPHPAGELLRAGVPVALGTDSLASNEGLDVLAEARLAWQSVPGTTARDWLHAATAAGARALGLAEVCGTLEPGKAADLIAVWPGAHAPDPYAAVLSPGSVVRLAVVEGEVLRDTCQAAPHVR